MIFRIRMKLSAFDAPERAISYCANCLEYLMTHADVFYVTKKSDTRKYKKQYTFCKECFRNHLSDEFEASK